MLPDTAKNFRSIEAMFGWRTPKVDVLKYVIASSSAAFAKHASDEGGSSVPIPELEVAGGDLQGRQVTGHPTIFLATISKFKLHR